MTSRNRPAAIPALAPADTAAGYETRVATLRVGAALPDPPFEFVPPEGPAGFDIELMQHIAAKLGRAWQLANYAGRRFQRRFRGTRDRRV
jgi:ABC-type amino acid transport substrate-binding protein